MEIAGNVAIITGGAGGLGEATARHLHGLGASVLIYDRDGVRAQALAEQLGERAASLGGDAADEHDTQAAVDAALELGQLRMVVATAGGATSGERTVKRDGTPHDLTLFTDTLTANTVTTFNTIRLTATAMAAQEPVDDDGLRGAIVTTASIAGIEGQIGQVAYGSAKAAVIGMTIVAARDLAAVGVRVNCIAPGTILTPAWNLAPTEARALFEAAVPFPRRFGRPDEYAALATHLLTNDYLNGHVARLDGAIRFGPR